VDKMGTTEIFKSFPQHVNEYFSDMPMGIIIVRFMENPVIYRYPVVIDFSSIVFHSYPETVLQLTPS
jgi:hypothetical protein